MIKKKNKTKNNAGISISDITKPVLKFIKRFSTIIIFLIVSIGLFVAIARLLPITNLTGKASPSAGQTVDGTFDQTTIDRLQKKDSSADSYQPGTRKSPFIE